MESRKSKSYMGDPAAAISGRIACQLSAHCCAFLLMKRHHRIHFSGGV